MSAAHRLPPATGPAVVPALAAASAGTAPAVRLALRALAPRARRVLGYSFAIHVLMLAPSLYMLQVYDRVMASRSLGTLLIVSVTLVLALALAAWLEVRRSRQLVQASQTLDDQLGEPVLAASLASHLRPASAGAARGPADLATLRQFLSGPAVLSLVDAPWSLFYVAVLFLLHPWLGAAAVLFAALQALLAWHTHRRTQALQQAGAQVLQEEARWARQSEQHAETLEALGMRPALRERWLRLRGRHRTAARAQSEHGLRAGGLSRWARHVQQSLSLAVGGWLVVRGDMSPGAMIAANLLMNRALAPIDQLLASWRLALDAQAAAGRLSTLLAAPEASASSAAPAAPAESASALQGEWAFRSVTAWSPDGRTPLLQDVDLHLMPGTVTLLLGPSGAGKSLLSRVALGLWPWVQGDVRLGGHRLNELDRHTLGPRLGYLAQDVELLEGSVADNIARCGTPDTDAVLAAARACGLHELILRLPRGYDTPVGPGGQWLSGGLRQRVALARAVYGQPQWLVLDEPNAHLDDAGEAALGRLLQARAQAGATVLVASHRPALLAVAHRVVVLQAGRVLHDGPRDTVLAALRSSPPTPSPATAPSPAAATPSDSTPAAVAPSAPTGPAAP